MPSKCIWQAGEAAAFVKNLFFCEYFHTVGKLQTLCPVFALCGLTTAYQDIASDRLKPLCEPEPHQCCKPAARDHAQHGLDPILRACKRKIKMSYRNDFIDTLFKKFSESRRVSVIYFKCNSSLQC